MSDSMPEMAKTVRNGNFAACSTIHYTPCDTLRKATHRARGRGRLFFHLTQIMLNIWKQRWKGEKSAPDVGGPEDNANVESIVTVPSTSEPSSGKRRANNEDISSRPQKKWKQEESPGKVEPEFTPTEIAVSYDHHDSCEKSTICSKISSIPISGKVVQRQLVLSRYALSEVGPWAADWVWKRALETGILVNEKGIHSLVRTSEFRTPHLDLCSDKFNLSPKVVKLIQILKSCEPYGDSFRGIVFVRRRIVALALTALIEALSQHLGFLHPVTMLHDTNNTTFSNFNHGTYNLAVATRSIEDSEMPKNLRQEMLMRRDRPYTIHGKQKGAVPPEILQDPVDYYFSDSDDEDATEEERIQDPTTGGLITLRNATSVLYRFLSQHGPPVSIRDPLFEFDEVGGGYLKGYTGRVILSHLAIDCPWSPVSTSKAIAKRRASFLCSLELFKAGRLDYRFFAPSQKRLREFKEIFTTKPDALPPLGEVYPGTRTYPRKTPGFWKHVATTNPKRLYPLIIRVTTSNSSVPYHAPMLMLTLQPLPDFPTFKVYFSGVPAGISLEKAATLIVNDQQLQVLFMYTLRVWRNIRNRPYTCSLDKMQYFFAPLDRDELFMRGESTSLPDITNAIPWDLVTLAAQHYAVPMKFGSANEIASDAEDAVIQDRWSQFTRRYDVVRVRSDLSPLSPPFETEPGKTQYETLVDFCKARNKDFNGLNDYKQALVEVSKFPIFVDRLNPSTPAGTEHGDSVVRYFIPELCAKCTIPASTMRTTLLIPCVLQRIDEFLLVKELNARLFSNIIPDDLLHVALTTRSAGLEYDYERLEMLGDAFLKYLASLQVFVSGPCRDEGHMHVARQRLISNKTLLECALSVGLPSYIQSRPFSLRNWQPPNFHVQIDSPNSSSEPIATRNVSSADAGSAHAIIPSDDNMPNSRPSDAEPLEAPNGTKKKGRKSKRKKVAGEQQVTYLGDKTVADVAEAIIGAAFVSGGSDAALQAAKSLNLPITPEIEQWSDFYHLAKTIPRQAPAGTRKLPVEQIEKIIGHRVKRPHLLAQALTHLSKANPEIASYSRLEFLGDAILDFMVVRHVFDRNQQLTPGALTLLKGAMVSNSALAAVCVRSGLHQYLLLGSSHLEDNIKSYIGILQQKENEEHANAIKEHRPIGQYWHGVETPKVLADIVESIIGAIYLSDDFTPTGAEKFFELVLKPFYDKHISLQTLSHHPTKVLLELVQGKGCHQFELAREGEQCLVLVHDIILAGAQDLNAAAAARSASLSALCALEGDPGFLRRTCDCSTRTTKASARKVLTGFEGSEFEIN
ncbi:Dicer-like protein 1 [Paramarasmius palmivorus]|uniref:Dicer-like protein 1 n=1 Tax=Paramarasmius palmivorus TaxID=297713 RepID=A0AAW0DGA4_9AGAR